MKGTIMFILLFVGTSAALLRIFGFRDQIPYWIVPGALAAYFLIKYFVKEKE